MPETQIEKESKEEVFNRLATARTTKAIKAIRQLEKLRRFKQPSGKTSQIVIALKTAIEKLEYALGGDEEEATEEEFSFEESSVAKGGLP